MDSANDSADPAVPQLFLAGSSTPPTALLTRIWATRELGITLARKEFFVRYRRATFGMVWAVAVPAIQAIVLAKVLSRFVSFAVPHYTVYVFSGMASWSYFGPSIGAGTTSIVDNSALSSRIYFPRSILPISSVLSNVFTLCVTCTILFITVLVSHVPLRPRMLMLIPAGLLCVAMTASLALVLSALHVYFRDVTYLVQAALLVWFYVTPIFYPLSRLDGTIRDIAVINPLTGVVQLFHWAVLPTTDVAVPLLWTAGWTVLLATVGVALHSRLDRSFADML